MQILREEYGNFIIILVADKKDHLRGRSTAFKGTLNCHMDREFKAINLNGDLEWVSRYDLNNEGRKFETKVLDYKNNQYWVPKGATLKELSDNDTVKTNKPNKQIQTNINNEPQKSSAAMQAVYRSEDEGDDIFESFTYSKYYQKD